MSAKVRKLASLGVDVRGATVCTYAGDIHLLKRREQLRRPDVQRVLTLAHSRSVQGLLARKWRRLAEARRARLRYTHYIGIYNALILPPTDSR